jgi:hypothetical protein
MDCMVRVSRWSRSLTKLDFDFMLPVTKKRRGLRLSAEPRKAYIAAL